MGVSGARRAFTLIELMVVVALFAIVSAVLIPNLIRARERARQNATLAEQLTEEPRPKGSPPLLEGIALELALESEPLRVGLDVANRYRLQYRGESRWSPGGEGSRRVLFELPVGVEQVEGLLLEVDSQGSWVEPEGVVYGRDFVAWTAPAEAFPLRSRLSYSAQGTDRLTLPWPAATKIRELTAQLRWSSPAGASFPLSSLRPQEEPGGLYRWQAQNVLNPAPIEVAFGAVDSPLAQAGQLFRLTGLALLLFGGGFWYLAELYQLGSLRDFRFGSFLLLAMTYSSFFVTVAVLSLDGRLPTTACLLLSMAFCLPLLAFHVSQLVDRRFALRYALPLALVTLSLVVIGVYGGTWRPVGLLVLALLVLAFLTASHRPFRRRQQEREAARAQALAQAQRGNAEVKARARQVEAALTSCLESTDLPAGFRALVTFCHSELSGLLGQSAWTQEQLEQQTQQWQEAIAAAESVLEDWQHQREQQRQERQRNPARGLHCCYCGAAEAPGRFCGACGRRQPERVPCPSCQSEVSISAADLSPQQSYHCCDCGSVVRPSVA